MSEQLKEKKFNLFVNLTENDYSESIRTIHFPIVDKSVPDDSQEYCKFILKLKKEYEKNTKMYIHCLAGHSRSSMVIVSLLFCIYNLELKDVINKVITIHRNRIKLREIWKYKSPFNYKQFSFLCTIHKNIYINVGSDSKVYNWLSPKNIKVNDMTLEEYFNIHFNPFEVYDFIKQNKYLMTKLKQTLLKNLIFIDKKADEYAEFFKNVREVLYD